MPHAFTLSDFDFALPPELIAQHPAPERSGSRLLDGCGMLARDRMFRELPGLLRHGDLLVFNDTRVIKARLLGHKDSGGAVEALVERVLDGNMVLAHVRASKSPRPASLIRFVSGDGLSGFDALMLRREGPDDSLFRLRLPSDPFALLERHGHVPLPPYITHADSADDEARYQTVFAASPGAVAAPTAALHFDAEVLRQIRAARRGHGGRDAACGCGHLSARPDAGPFSAQDAHRVVRRGRGDGGKPSNAMRAANGGRVVAVGTTTLRALESAALGGAGSRPGSRDTDIFITPGFELSRRRRAAHQLPPAASSTLLMLVSAFAGHEQHEGAVRTRHRQRRYRFFSYGDAMLLQRARGKA